MVGADEPLVCFFGPSSLQLAGTDDVSSRSRNLSPFIYQNHPCSPCDNLDPLIRRWWKGVDDWEVRIPTRLGLCNTKLLLIKVCLAMSTAPPGCSVCRSWDGFWLTTYGVVNEGYGEREVGGECMACQFRGIVVRLETRCAIALRDS